MIRALLRVFVAPALALSLSGCAAPPSNGITQVATIDALLAGVYDGHMSLRMLRAHGDFGIGTFAGLDGEMLLMDGTFYKVREDGTVCNPPLSERTPFACVTSFAPDLTDAIRTPTDMKALEARIDALVPQHNRFCAFRIRGNFRYVKTRSVPAQKKPYPPLAEVTRTQRVFALSNVRGVVIGFRSPAFVKGVNVPGYHMHFLADDLSGGGHVLDFEATDGALTADTVHEWLSIHLPTGSTSFYDADLTRDRTTDLKTVEGNPQGDTPGKPGAGERK